MPDPDIDRNRTLKSIDKHLDGISKSLRNISVALESIANGKSRSDKTDDSEQ